MNNCPRRRRGSGFNVLVLRRLQQLFFLVKLKFIKMKKLLFSLACLFSLQAFSQDVISDPNAVTRSLSGSFTGISVSSGVELYLTQAASESIAVSASDSKYLDRFKTEVVDGVLKIYFDNNGLTWTKSEKRHLKAYVSFVTLKKLNGSAGSHTILKGDLKSDDMEMKFSSGAVFEGAVMARQLSVDQSSGSVMKMSGKANNFQVDVSSGAMFKGYEFAVDYCHAKANSGASVNITINKELTAKANSGGDIRYKGEALIRDVDISSGGSVKRS